MVGKSEVVGGRRVRSGLDSEECAKIDGVRVLRDDKGKLLMEDSVLE
jgi:hypothetical protein